jgi:hypothetical protein
MKTYDKTPLGVTPRHFWLKNRISECVTILCRIEDSCDYDLYLKQSLVIANEIIYAAEEWEKYCNEQVID